jgi:hypothetical protein
VRDVIQSTACMRGQERPTQISVIYALSSRLGGDACVLHACWWRALYDGFPTGVLGCCCRFYCQVVGCISGFDIGRWLLVGVHWLAAGQGPKLSRLVLAFWYRAGLIGHNMDTCAGLRVVMGVCDGMCFLICAGMPSDPMSV